MLISIQKYSFVDTFKSRAIGDCIFSSFFMLVSIQKYSFVYTLNYLQLVTDVFTTCNLDKTQKCGFAQRALSIKFFIFDYPINKTCSLTFGLTIFIYLLSNIWMLVASIVLSASRLVSLNYAGLYFNMDENSSFERIYGLPVMPKA